MCIIITIYTYINLDAILYGGVRCNVPANIDFVRCKPDCILSKTGKPRRCTNSFNICWFLFKSKYSLK